MKILFRGIKILFRGIKILFRGIKILFRGIKILFRGIKILYRGIKEREPVCEGVRAIWSPHTGIVDWGRLGETQKKFL